MTHIATLAGNIADYAKIKAQATEMINVKEKELITTKAMLQKGTDSYMKIYLANKAEMPIRNDDLAGFLHAETRGVQEGGCPRPARWGNEDLRSLWRPGVALRRRGAAGGVREQLGAISAGGNP